MRLNNEALAAHARLEDYGMPKAPPSALLQSLPDKVLATAASTECTTWENATQRVLCLPCLSQLHCRCLMLALQLLPA